MGNLQTIDRQSCVYPPQLAELPNYPKVLYAIGNTACLGLPYIISIVGSRKMTEYGSLITKKLVSQFNRQIVLVSGFVEGIDITAHDSALAYSMPTIAVLGYGFNHLKSLDTKKQQLCQSIIARGGCLLSEYNPDFKPTRWSFVKRNRIIAALPKCVVVIEAESGSGALVTASIALKLKRGVYTVPQDLFKSHSHGFCQLINQGANALVFGSQINEYLGLDDVEKVPVESVLCSKYVTIYQSLKEYPKTLDELIQTEHMLAEELTTGLAELQFSGDIVCKDGLYYVC